MKQLQEKSHRIVRLEDRDGDGKFDQSVVFADKMMFPEGVLWFEGAVIQARPPFETRRRTATESRIGARSGMRERH